MTTFTPYTALLGGALIGISAVLMMWLLGRIAGISGIMGGLLPPKKNDIDWRLFFVLGLIIGGFAYYLFTPIQFAPRQGFPILLLLIAGFCVGFGTRLGSGCTSGHGVCGVARISKRSLMATCIFVAFGMISVFIVRHIFGVG